MRGRTNITQRKQPLINGQLKEFVVESGNTIKKGDFVSPVYSKQVYDWRIFEDCYDKFTVDKSNGKYILILHNNAHLIQFDGSEINILDSLDVTSYRSGCYYDAESNKFILTPNYPDVYQDVLYAKEYTIINDSFVFVKNIDLLSIATDIKQNYYASSQTDRFSFKVIIPNGNGYICFAETKYIKQATYSYVTSDGTCCAFCDSNFNVYDLQKTGTYPSGALEPGFLGVCFRKTSNGNIFFITNRVNLYILSTKTLLHSSVFSNNESFDSLDFNDSKTFVVRTKYEGGTTASYFSYVYIEYNGLSEINGVDKYSLYCFNKDGDLFGLKQNLYTYSDYSEEDMLVTLVQTENYTFPIQPISFFSLSSGGSEIILFLKSSDNTAIKYMFTKYELGKVYFGDLTNKVKSYDGTAIGFAGGSGNAGDTILVYVPLSN